MSLGRDEEAIRIVRIDDDGCNLLRVAQSEMLPGAARVGRFVDAIAYREIGAAQAFTTADVNRVGTRRRDRERSNRTCGLVIEDRIPGAAEVGGFPDSAVVRRHVEGIRLARNAR